MRNRILAAVLAIGALSGAAALAVAAPAIAAPGHATHTSVQASSGQTYYGL